MPCMHVKFMTLMFSGGGSRMPNENKARMPNGTRIKCEVRKCEGAKTGNVYNAKLNQRNGGAKTCIKCENAKKNLIFILITV